MPGFSSVHMQLYTTDANYLEDLDQSVLCQYYRCASGRKRPRTSVRFPETVALQTPRQLPRMRTDRYFQSNLGTSNQSLYDDERCPIHWYLSGMQTACNTARQRYRINRACDQGDLFGRTGWDSDMRLPSEHTLRPLSTLQFIDNCMSECHCTVTMPHVVNPTAMCCTCHEVLYGLSRSRFNRPRQHACYVHNSRRDPMLL